MNHSFWFMLMQIIHSSAKHNSSSGTNNAHNIKCFTVVHIGDYSWNYMGKNNSPSTDSKEVVLAIMS